MKTKMRKLFKLIVGGLACLIVAGSTFSDPLTADILVSNLSEPLNPNGPTVIGNTPGGPDDQAWGAQAFVTDSNPWLLTHIQANMGNALSDTIPMRFELRKTTNTSEIDMSASGLITDFGFPSDMTGANQIHTFSLLDEIFLQANTKYWFMVGIYSGNNETFEWEYSNTGNFTGPGSLAEYGVSFDQGASWSYPVDPYFPWTLQVNGTVVPEPGVGLAGAFLLCGFAAAPRRRRK